MRDGFPYKAVPCSHCANDDMDCPWCLGSHREIKPIVEDEGKAMVWLWVAAIIALVILIIFGSE